MRHLKAVAVGLGVGLIAAALWVVGNRWLPIYTYVTELRDDAGIGVVGGVSIESTLLAMLIGFAAGYYWTLRRASHQAASPS